MIPYQRYLREKKETELDQELDEAAAWKKNIGKLNPADQQRLKTGLAGKEVKPRVTSDPGGTGFSRAQSVGTNKAAGEKANKLGDIRQKLSNKDKKTDTNLPYARTDSGFQKEKSPESVSGDTVSQIISSAGGNRSSVPSIILAIKSALRKSGLELKDTSFLV